MVGNCPNKEMKEKTSGTKVGEQEQDMTRIKVRLSGDNYLQKNFQKLRIF